MSKHPITDPAITPDFFVTGLSNVEQIAPDIYRFTFHAEQSSMIDNRTERVIVARLVMTAEALDQVRRFSHSAIPWIPGDHGKAN